MQITAIEGLVENGKIRLCEEVSLPENARVYVIVADVLDERPARIFSPRLAHPKQLKDFVKKVVELASDATV